MVDDDYRNSSINWFSFIIRFFSKDAIIEFAYLRGNATGILAAYVGIFTAFLTAIYSWRLIFKTFHGQYNNEEIKLDKIHESSFLMLIPLVILSVGSVFAGFIFKDLFIDQLNTFNFWKRINKIFKSIKFRTSSIVHNFNYTNFSNIINSFVTICL